MDTLKQRPKLWFITGWRYVDSKKGVTKIASPASGLQADNKRLALDAMIQHTRLNYLHRAHFIKILKESDGSLQKIYLGFCARQGYYIIEAENITEATIILREWYYQHKPAPTVRFRLSNYWIYRLWIKPQT